MERRPQALLTSSASLAISGDGLRLVASTSDSPCLQLSQDGGASWQQAACSGGWAAVAIAANGSRMFAGNSNARNIQTSSEGLSWSSCGIIAPGDQAFRAFSIAASADGQRVTTAASPYTNIYSGTFVYTSTDSCATWVKQ